MCLHIVHIVHICIDVIYKKGYSFLAIDFSRLLLLPQVVPPLVANCVFEGKF